MERDKLISRQRDPEYRSKIIVKISAQGRMLIDRLIDIANEYEEQSITNLSDADIRELRRLLSQLVNL